MANRKAQPATMLYRNADGKVVEIPTDQYMASKGAWPDIVMEGAPEGGQVTARMLNDPAKTRALEVAKAKLALTPSLSQMGSVNPATTWTDTDFSRLLELQRPMERPRTQKDIDEEQFLKNKLAASTAEMQRQPMGYKVYGADAKLTPERIAQMYPATSDVESQVAAERQTPAYQDADRELAAERSRSIQKAMEVATQKRQAALEGAYGRDNAMLSPENRWLASSAESPQNIMVPPPKPLTGPLPTSDQLEEPPQELVGDTAAGAQMRALLQSSDGSIAGSQYGQGRWQGTSPAARPAAAPAATTTTAPSRPQATPIPPVRTSDVSRGEAPSFLSRIFSGGGEDRQSTGARVQDMDRQGRAVVNWGSPESAADLFRADKAAREWNAKNADNQAIGAGSSADTGLKRGGAVGGKDAAMHKALEIIHHLLMRGQR